MSLYTLTLARGDSTPPCAHVHTCIPTSAWRCRAICAIAEMSQRNGGNKRDRCHPCERLIRRCAHAGQTSVWVLNALRTDTIRTFPHLFENLQPGKPVTLALASENGSPRLQHDTMRVAPPAGAPEVTEDADVERADFDSGEQQPVRVHFSPPATRRALRALHTPSRDTNAHGLRTPSTERSTPPAALRAQGLDQGRAQPRGGSLGAGGSSRPTAKRGTQRRNPGRKSTTAARAAAAAAFTNTGANLNLYKYPSPCHSCVAA